MNKCDMFKFEVEVEVKINYAYLIFVMCVAAGTIKAARETVEFLIDDSFDIVRLDWINDQEMEEEDVDA